MATPKKQPSVKQSKPRAKTRQPATAAAGDCNPCFEQQPGFLTCDGSGPVVVPFPHDGHWVLTVKNGVIVFENAAGIVPAEDVSEPTEPEPTPPDAEPMPPAPAPE